MKKINVNLKENSCEIFIQKNILNRFRTIADQSNLKGRYFLLLDSNVNRKAKEKISKFLSDQNISNEKMILSASEKNKSFVSLEKILGRMIKLNANRDSLLIAIGGGIIGDIGGFAAATYSRGIKYVQVPTTLLACVDSSVGGKTGINFSGIKNIVGSYHQPSVVLIDPEFLKTLKPAEVLSGMGEIIKYALLSDEEFFDYVRNNLNSLYSLNTKVVAELIERSVKFKAGVVAQDEKETLGIRKILNLGHTFGHAIEADQNYKIKHGQAVIIGIVCSLYLSKRLGLLTGKKFDEIIDPINWFKGKIKVKNYNVNSMIRAMKKDKKNSEGRIKFVLLKDIGKTLVNVEAERGQIVDSINEGMKFFK
jgi:3-dehydroquinate synthase